MVMALSTWARPVVALLSVSLLLAACGDEVSTSSGGSVSPSVSNDQGSASGELAFGLLRCDPDARVLQADPAFYRDEPVYVANEQPTEEVRSWAATRPGYEDIWLDRDNNGWISVGFSENAAARQEELEAEFPGVGVVAVHVPAGETELQALRVDVQAALQGLSSWGLGHTVARGMVEVSVPVLDEETLARLAPLAGPTLCVSGADPAEAVPDGPQPTEGAGWRLLGTDRTGTTYRTGVATSPEQYRDLWQMAGLAGDVPEVDFETEVVIWFGAVYGSGCPIRLDDVVVDTASRVVHGNFVLPGNPTSCNADANPDAYMVALLRSRLPEAPFVVQLDADDPPAGAPEERTTVQVDLRPAGSMASDDELVVEYLDDIVAPRYDVFEPGLVIEDGYPWIVLIERACPIDVLGPLNGTMWRALTVPGDTSAGDVSDDLIEAELLLSTDPAQLTVTIQGNPMIYEPIAASEDAAMDCT